MQAALPETPRDSMPESGSPNDAEASLEPPLSTAAMSPWLLVLFFVLTWGLYAPVLAYRLSRTLRDPRRSPWNWAIGSVIPFANLLVFYRISRAINARAYANDIVPGLGPGIRLLLYMAANAVAFVIGRSDNYLTDLFGAAMMALPWLGVQFLVNRAAARENEPAPPRRWVWPRRIVLAGFVMLHGYSIWGSRAVWYRMTGRALAAGERVRGRSQSYSLKTPGTGWVETKRGALGQGNDGDLELVGPDDRVTAIVYVYDYPNQSLDARVDERRRLFLAEATGEPQIVEQRLFTQGQALAPVSIAHYDPGRSGTAYWVATLDESPRFTEIVVAVPRGSVFERDAEQLVRSVMLESSEPSEEGPT